MIEIRELTKYYGEAKAAGPLTFDIAKGEVVGLLGLNGAGKTTTLRMLASDLLPTSGKMTIDGVDLVEQPERVRAKIGYLPDRPPLYGEMRVREYLRFAARLRGMPAGEASRRVDEVLELTSLAARADDRIDTLSHGYKQRVGIGQAIVHRPSLLLLDEPISGLDPAQIVEMRELIRSLRGAHTTVLSSHILSEISETCDRLLVMRDGEIVASGSESELAARMAATRVDVTVRAAARASAAALLREVPGVEAVDERPADEPGEGVAKLSLATVEDVRAEICRRLVHADIDVLGLERSGLELESVFLQLAGSIARRGAAGAEEVPS